MRMWNVNPKLMCNKHLCGEHVEMHMFVGAINKGKSINGYINNGLVDTQLIRQRHDMLVQEMLGRKMKHNSPLQNFKHIDKCGSVNIKFNEKELARRCEMCKKRSKK